MKKAIDEIKTIVRDDLKKLMKNFKLIIFLVIYIVIILLLIRVGKALELVMQLFLNKNNLIPFTIIIPYYSLVALVPFLSVFLTYESISKQRNKKSLRFIFTKIDRKSFVLAKIITPFLIISALTFFTFLGITLYTFFKINNMVFTEMFFAWILMMLYSLCFIAISIYWSSKNADQGHTLRLSIVSIIILAFFLVNKNLAFISPFRHIANGIKIGIVPSGEIITSIFVFLFYITIFCLGALKNIKHSDE